MRRWKSYLRISGTALSARRNQMADIFISYWVGEQGVADSLYGFLAASLPGKTTIFMADSRTIRAGDSWLEIIKRELKESKVVLSILSNDSVKRPWINFEAGAAWIDKILIPLCFGTLEKGAMPAPYNQLQALQLREPLDAHRLVKDLYWHLAVGKPPIYVHLPLGSNAPSEYQQRLRHFLADIHDFEHEGV
jgi:TIR domain